MQSNTSLNTSFPAAEHGAAGGDNQPAAAPSASGGPAEEEKDESSGGSSTIASIFNSATGFMSLAAKEWLSSLVNQPTEPPFGYNARFDNELVRVVRLVVMVVLLTGIVVGSERLLAAKTAPTLVVALAMKVLIAAFLAAIVYSIFAFSAVSGCGKQHGRGSPPSRSSFRSSTSLFPGSPFSRFCGASVAGAGQLGCWR